MAKVFLWGRPLASVAKMPLITNEFRSWTVALCTKDKRGRVEKVFSHAVGENSHNSRPRIKSSCLMKLQYSLNSTLLHGFTGGFGYGEKRQICPNTSSLY